MERGITVFTPIYNRKYCIETLYESLKRQTYNNFEWIVVDDGSTDNVAQLFEAWMQEENDFDIIYVKVKNGGKMRAVNKGVKLAATPAFFIVDSDDYLTDDALELLLMWFKDIENNNFAGVSGLKKIKTIDAEYDFDYVDATNFERRKYNLVIDMAECYKTDILKKYPAPEFENETYLSPSVVWNRIAKDGYKLRWFNKVIYIAEYRADGLSAAGLANLVNSPVGWGQLIQLAVEYKKDEKFKEFQYFWYYQNLKNSLSMDNISLNLGLTPEKLSDIISRKPRIIIELNEYFAANGIKKVALYGMGGEAKRFLQLISDIDIEICYGIDKRPNSLLPLCYSLVDELPTVDAILITNRMGIKDIKDDIKRRTKIRSISLQEDILDNSLNYYFSNV